MNPWATAVLQEVFEDCFRKQYSLIHRLETNKLRNVSSLFAHLLATDGISWAVLMEIRLTEQDTTSSSRIFVKYLFQVRGSMTVGVRSEVRKPLATCTWQPG
jgi:hypothetical protein